MVWFFSEKEIEKYFQFSCSAKKHDHRLEICDFIRGNDDSVLPIEKFEYELRGRKFKVIAGHKVTR